MERLCVPVVRDVNTRSWRPEERK